MKKKDNYVIWNELRRSIVKQKEWTVVGVMLFVLLFHWADVWTSERNALNFGVFVTNADDALDTKQLGDEFSPVEDQEVLMLSLNEKIVVWYSHRPDEQMYLSVFEQGEEQVLLKSMEIFGPFTTPVLAKGFLNLNEIPDLLISYTDNCGTGRTSECWDQELRFFFDEQTVASSPVSLSAVDSVFGTQPEDCAQPGDCWENRQETLVLLIPASEQTPCTIYVWYQRYRSEDQPPGATERMYTYEIVEYQVSGTQLVEVETTKGSQLQTSELLRSLIWSKREQGEEPLLLNFMYSPYLFDENTWLNFFTYRE